MVFKSSWSGNTLGFFLIQTRRTDRKIAFQIYKYLVYSCWNNIKPNLSKIKSNFKLSILTINNGSETS